jgi:hypothetical protein
MTNQSIPKTFRFFVIPSYFIALVLCLPCFGQESLNHLDRSQPITHTELIKPSLRVNAVVKAKPAGFTVKQTGDSQWSISGDTDLPATLILAPQNGTWDFTGYSLFSIALNNDGPGTVWVQARLDNQGAEDWTKSSNSQAYLLPGERGTVTVAYPRGWETDDSPEAFEPASSKPNGWRSHWKSFDASKVTRCRLVVRSNKAKIRLREVTPYLAWPYGKDANRELLNLPHLDRFGQAIPFDWQTKVHKEDDLTRYLDQETKSINTGPAGFNAFGGDATGLQREATGYFRTEKVNGKWWLIDPEGRLFWSHGVCTVGNRAIVPLSPDRRKLLSYIPEPGTAEHDASVVPYKPYGEWGRAVDYLRLNTMRKYGEGWEEKSRDITHRRLRAWGLNTLGAWSDTDLQNDQRTPFTEILHIWPGTHALGHTPDPYDPSFEQRVHEAVSNLAKTRRQDPWMIGVFIDNEIVWHNNFVERVFKAGTKQPAYSAFIQELKSNYPTIEALNKAWGTKSSSWDEIQPGKTQAWQKDGNELFAMLTDRYYRICKEAVDKHLPNHLYLGSRVHTCPPIVAGQIAKYVDVFSVNHYAPLAGSAQLPKEVDLPVMVTEFHFGTMDRGVTGMSLSPVHDQTQRVRSYAAYVTAGLIHPNVVGTHWFAYSDQSAVGRPNENYQIGLIDVTDTPYPAMTAMTRAISERMYQLRQKQNAQLLNEVEKLIQSIE